MFWFALRSGYDSETANSLPSAPDRPASAAIIRFIASASAGFAAARWLAL